MTILTLIVVFDSYTAYRKKFTFSSQITGNLKVDKTMNKPLLTFASLSLVLVNRELSDGSVKWPHVSRHNRQNIQ